MHHPTPRQTITWSLRFLAVTGPLSLLTLVAWGMHWLRPLEVRPQLVLMVYMLLLLASAAAGMVAIMASCHVAIGEAFSAGMRVAQAEAQLADTVDGEPAKVLQLVTT